MNFAMTTILSTLAIALVVIPLLTAIVFANTTTNSNHVKWCLKQKDKRTRSIMCPDVFSKSETTINLYG